VIVRIPLLTITTPTRGNDTWGSGDFGASRAGRLHMGIDYAAMPGSILQSPVTGVVTKLGYCYGDDLSYRYVQVTTHDGARHRFFYIEPDVVLNSQVQEGYELGEVQDVTRRYQVPKGMKPHIHYEIIDKDKLYVSPEAYHGRV